MKLGVLFIVGISIGWEEGLGSSRCGPWVITVDNFADDGECEGLVRYGATWSTTWGLPMRRAMTCRVGTRVTTIL